MDRGYLITFEGIECAGKGTQIAKARQYLTERGFSIVCQHEPGGTPYGEALRAVLKHPEIALPAVFNAVKGHSDFVGVEFGEDFKTERTALAELFIFEAVRSEFANKIRVLLDSWQNVISDRLMDSTTAYQGGGRGLGRIVDQLNVLAMQGVWPDKTFFLDIPVDVMLERMKNQNDEKNSFFEKNCDRDFFERVRKAYLKIADTERARFIVIDGAQSVEDVFDQIKPYLNFLFNIK